MSTETSPPIFLRERLPDPGNRAISHHNLGNYLHDTGAPDEAGAHYLAALAYLFSTGLDLRAYLRAHTNHIRHSAARGERYDLPRLADILPTPAFAPLRTFLTQYGISPADLQTRIDALLDQLRAPG